MVRELSSIDTHSYTFVYISRRWQRNVQESETRRECGRRKKKCWFSISKTKTVFFFSPQSFIINWAFSVKLISVFIRRFFLMTLSWKIRLIFNYGEGVIFLTFFFLVFCSNWWLFSSFIKPTSFSPALFFSVYCCFVSINNVFHFSNKRNIHLNFRLLIDTNVRLQFNMAKDKCGGRRFRSIDISFSSINW